MLCICHSMRLICKSRSVVQNCIDVSPKCFMDLQVCIWWLLKKVFCFVLFTKTFIWSMDLKFYPICITSQHLFSFYCDFDELSHDGVNFSTYPLWVLTTILRDYLNVLITKTFIGCVDLKLDLICLMLGYEFNLFGMCCYFGSVEDLKY